VRRPRLRLAFGAEQQKLAVNSGVWPLYRYDPRRIETASRRW
jgi:pyruvate/2-oxoacid:ferredoxin oxidoreductase beta subunit